MNYLKASIVVFTVAVVASAAQVASCRCGERSSPQNKARRPAAPDAASLLVEVDNPDAGVNLPIVDEREPNNWPEFAMTVKPGVAIRGKIGYPLTPKMGDRDVYCFDVKGDKRQVLRAELRGVSGLKLGLEVRTVRWGTIHTSSSLAPGKGLIVPNLSLKPGKYCFVVLEARGGPPFRFNRKNAYLLTFSLRPEESDEEREANDRFYAANPLEPGKERRGLLGRRQDRDWYRLALTGLPSRSLLSVTFIGVEGVTADVSVYNYARKLIASRRGTRGATIYIRDLRVQLHTGFVYIAVDGHQRFNPDSWYRIKVEATRATASREVEPNDTANRAVSMSGTRGEMRGIIEVARDVDWYQLPVIGHANVKIELQPPPGLDGQLLVTDLRGRKLGEANEGKAGEPELLTNVRAYNGIRIRVSGDKGTFAARSSYRLRWVTTPADRGDEREPNNVLKQANVLLPGVSSRGYIYPMGDVDWYRFRLPGDLGGTQKIRISVQGILQVRLKLTLLDDQKNVLATKVLPTAEGLREITTTLHAAKAYYVLVQDEHNRRVNKSDNYELTLALLRR